MALALPTARASRWVPPAPGMMPSVDLRLAELGGVGGDDDVAHHRQLAAAAQRKAGNRGDHRLALRGDRDPSRRGSSPR